MENWITPIWRWYRARRWWWQGLIAIGLVLVALTVLGSVLPSQDDEQGLVRSSAGVSSTPTGKRVIAIPVTSTPGPGEAAYLDVLPKIMTDWASIASDLGDLATTAGNQPTLLFTASWQSSVLDALDEGRLLRSRVNALKPSARLAAPHQAILAALDAQDGVDREMRAAIDAINAGDIASATTRFESAVQFTDQIARHLDTATSLLPTP